MKCKVRTKKCGVECATEETPDSSSSLSSSMSVSVSVSASSIPITIKALERHGICWKVSAFKYHLWASLNRRQIFKATLFPDVKHIIRVFPIEHLFINISVWCCVEFWMLQMWLVSWFLHAHTLLLFLFFFGCVCRHFLRFGCIKFCIRWRKFVESVLGVRCSTNTKNIHVLKKCWSIEKFPHFCNKPFVGLLFRSPQRCTTFPHSFVRSLARSLARLHCFARSISRTLTLGWVFTISKCVWDSS